MTDDELKRFENLNLRLNGAVTGFCDLFALVAVKLLDAPGRRALREEITEIIRAVGPSKTSIPSEEEAEARTRVLHSVLANLPDD